MATHKTPAPAAVKKRAPRKSAFAAPTSAAKSTTTMASFVDPEKRAALIAEAAYYRAEQRGFAPGHATQDWLAAEAEVDAKLLHAADHAHDLERPMRVTHACAGQAVGFGDAVRDDGALACFG